MCWKDYNQIAQPLMPVTHTHTHLIMLGITCLVSVSKGNTENSPVKAFFFSAHPWSSRVGEFLVCSMCVNR